MPPLRERTEDIPLLAGFLLAKLGARMGGRTARLSEEALEALSSYHYPGNVRELENMLERALIYAEGGEILAADLGLAGAHRLAAASSAYAREPPVVDAGVSSLDSMERGVIEGALARWDGNRTKAARDLGISRRTMLYKIKRYGL